MRFTLGKLLYLIALLAICFTVFRSETPGVRSSLVTSIDFAPDGEQLVVSLHEFNGGNRQVAAQFDRTISILDYPRLKPVQIAVRDRQTRTAREKPSGELNDFFVLSEWGTDTFFWNSQTHVKHVEQHLFFLDSDCQKLVCYEIESGRKRTTAVFEAGPIFAFDVSNDGRQILLQGQSIMEDPNRNRAGSIVVIDDDQYLIPELDGSAESAQPIELQPDRKLAIAYHDVLGIDAAEPVVIPPDPNKSANRSLRLDRENDRQGMQMAQDNQIFNNLSVWWKMQTVPLRWRLAFLETSSKNPNVALIVTYDLKQLALGSQDNRVPGRLEMDSTSWASAISDFDVSHRGYCCCARLLRNGKLVLTIATDLIPEQDFVNVIFRCEDDSPSRICLSRDGKRLAVASKNAIEIFQLDNLLANRQPELIQDIKNHGRLFREPERNTRIELQQTATSLSFSPDGKRLLVGDDQGSLTQFESQSGQFISAASVPGKPRALQIYFVVPILAVWLFLGLVWFRKSKKCLPEQQEIQYLSVNVE